MRPEEQPYWQKEASTASYPPLAVGSQAAAEHHALQVRVV
jgi:hypothetical protein